MGGKEKLFLFAVLGTPSSTPQENQTSKFPKNIKNLLMFFTKAKLVYFQSIGHTTVPLTSKATVGSDLQFVTN